MRGQAILIAGLMLAAYSGQAAAQTIAGSPHDLANGVDDNNEICVYCHTPHGSLVGVEAPLWNKPNPGSSYTTYDSTTIDGEVLAVGSVSIACLTCHDGTQAMDAVINAPGSGAGDGLGPGGSTLIKGGALMAANIANLGTNLANDHPIGIQYGGFQPTAASAPIDPDFKFTLVTDLNSATILGRTRWWVNTSEPGGTDAREKTDMILYTRLNPDSTEDEPFVECATCHDPHNDDSGADGLAFMRISNVDSDVCLACHVK